MIDGFSLKWQTIQCAGAINGCHIPVKPPSFHHTDYYNGKGWYLVILQAVVNHNYLFTDLITLWLFGQAASMIQESWQTLSCTRRQQMKRFYFTWESRTILGKDIMPFLIGGSAYPLTTWLMKPFACNSYFIP